jgi:hypothetical protein
MKEWKWKIAGKDKQENMRRRTARNEQEYRGKSKRL